MLDPATVSAISALFGSVIGGSATLATTWLAQAAQGRRERLADELKRRESLYGDFISECSKLLIDSLERSLDKPETMIPAFASFNRMRVTSSERVMTAGEAVLRAVVDRYFRKNMTVEEVRNLVLRDRTDFGEPLQEFTIACREELNALKSDSSGRFH